MSGQSQSLEGRLLDPLQHGLARYQLHPEAVAALPFLHAVDLGGGEGQTADGLGAFVFQDHILLPPAGTIEL